MVGMLAFQVYESGMEGRRICKQKAEFSLKSATELWASREFDQELNRLIMVLDNEIQFAYLNLDGLIE